MGNILNKSIDNLTAAKILIDNDNYAPSVHCSYYSCFQYVRFALKNYKKITYQELDDLCGATEKGSHIAIKDFLFQNIKSKFIISDDFIRFKRKYNDLKEFREVSDYSEQIIYKNVSLDCLSKSQEIQNSLKTLLK